MRKLRAHYFELIENANFMYYLACLYPEQIIVCSVQCIIITSIHVGSTIRSPTNVS